MEILKPLQNHQQHLTTALKIGHSFLKKFVGFFCFFFYFNQNDLIPSSDGLCGPVSLALVQEASKQPSTVWFYHKADKSS